MATKATKPPKLSSILIREIGLGSVKEVTQVRTFQSKMLRCQWLLAAHKTEREKRKTRVDHEKNKGQLVLGLDFANGKEKKTSKIKK